MKLFVLGLDGASYELISQFVVDGYLPTFKEIMEDGYYSILKSSVPPHTAPGWVSSLTGVNPGEHGVFQFWETQASNYEGAFMGSNSTHVPFVWDLLNGLGFTTGMINIPMTHPPKETNGYILTWPLSNTLRYCYPENLVKEIAENNGHYVSDLVTMYSSDADYINKAIKITKDRLKTIKYLLKSKPSDFFMSVFTEIDRVSHFYWNFIDYNEECSFDLRDAIKEIYMETDHVIREVIDTLPDDTLLLIYSDHGFQKCKYDFYIQSYLLQEGLLSLKSVDGNYKIQHNWFEYAKGNQLYCVDWEKTVAYMAAPGSYGVNINLKNRQSSGIVETKQYEKIRDKVINIIKKAQDPDTGEPLFEHIYKREEVYSGDMILTAPDILLIPKDFSVMVHHKITPGILHSENVEQPGIHSMNGILMLYGKKLNEYRYHEPTSLIDIAPTILEVFHIDTPSYMEGSSVLETNRLKVNNTFISNDNQNKNTSTYSTKENSEIKDRLKNLGYL